MALLRLLSLSIDVAVRSTNSNMVPTSASTSSGDILLELSRRWRVRSGVPGPVAAMACRDNVVSGIPPAVTSSLLVLGGTAIVPGLL